MAETLASVFGTPRGQQLQAQLFARDSGLTININSAGLNQSYGAPATQITVDPGSRIFMNTTAGIIVASNERILGHELGHAIGGYFDNGPNRMNNVIANENPIATFLRQPARTSYVFDPYQ